MPGCILLSSCSFRSYIPTPSLRNTVGNHNSYVNNTVPKNNFYEKFYDLTFALNFTNQKTQEFGTGWLIDWKGDETKDLNTLTIASSSIISSVSNHSLKEKQDDKLFIAYIATNLHVIDGLKNDHDYQPYNKDGNGLSFPFDQKTQSFLLGRFANPKINSKPEEMNYQVQTRLKQDAMVFIQTSTLPKTAYAGIDPINFDYHETSDESGFWTKKRSTENFPRTRTLKSYADFAVLEVSLFLDNVNDAKIYQEWIRPAVQAYKELGDVENIFAKTPYTEYINNTYYLLGYPVTNNNKYQFILGQDEKWKFSQQTSVLKHYQKQPFQQRTVYVERDDGLPTLTFNEDKLTHVQGTDLINVDQITDTNLGNGLINYAGLSRFTLSYHNVEYKLFGYGTILNNTNFPGGSSGSAVFNKEKQLTSIYFGSLINVTIGNNRNVNLGLGQILRTYNTNNSKHSAPSSYDLIFGDKNTIKFYAQFAKEKQTHLWNIIQTSVNYSISFYKDKK
ncbi:DUF31 family protein [Mycoplasmoides genitalium]|uniref:DUF31 family protein n=1 Tax=Mycoplasmoides genitalium TaxID=2097 RepID=UPI002FCDFF6F